MRREGGAEEGLLMPPSRCIASSLLAHDSRPKLSVSPSCLFINKRPLVAAVHFGARRVKNYFSDFQMRREGGAEKGLLMPPSRCIASTSLAHNRRPKLFASTSYLSINERPLVAPEHFGARRVKSYFSDFLMRREGGAEE